VVWVKEGLEVVWVAETNRPVRFWKPDRSGVGFGSIRF